jgi:hypothetical protein
MPIFDDIGLELFDLPNSHYGYSATRIDDLGQPKRNVLRQSF